jgi:anti-anti-sigma factor
VGSNGPLMRTLPLPNVPNASATHLVGTVRAGDVAWFEDLLLEALARTTTDLQIDLRDVQFMDGAGVRVLAAIAARLAVDGHLLILHAPAFVVERALAERLPDGPVRIYRA